MGRPARYRKRDTECSSAPTKRRYSAMLVTLNVPAMKGMGTMALTLRPLLLDAGIDPGRTMAIRHAYVREHLDSGLRGINADSTDAEILEYTRQQSASAFPSTPPRYWIVFLREGGNKARFWSVVENISEVSNNGVLRTFELVKTDHMADLKNRLVIGWNSPRAWRVKATTVADYPVFGIADATPEPFPGYDKLVFDYARLQAVIREHRYEAWRTALASVKGIYLITDTRDGQQYVGKADGSENILQRWRAYAANGHGGNKHLKGRDPRNYRFSLLRVFDPAAPDHAVNASEAHFKFALESVKFGLNGG